MSIYPVNRGLPIVQSFSNLINRNYRGYTFKKTVERHLIEMTEAVKKSQDFCKSKIEFSKTSEERIYWEKVLKKVNDLKITPHDCNIDYTLFMIKDMPIEEIVSKYDKVTIGDIKKSRQL
jgi:hypothetical protein